MVGVLDELRKLGHDVRLATGPDTVRSASSLMLFTPQPTDEAWRGPPVQPLANDRSPTPVAATVGSQVVSGDSDLDDFLIYGAPAAAELMELLRDQRPDYVILDTMLWGAMVGAEASKVPWAALAHTVGSLPTINPRLFGPGLPPPRTAVGRFRQAFAASAMRRIQDIQILPYINALRRASGVPELRHAYENAFGAAVTIACTAEPFEYTRDDWHPSVRFVGPIAWDAPAPIPAWLDELDQRPMVLVCTSSVPQSDEYLTEVALKALGGADVQVVVTTPSRHVPADQASNVRVERYVPHSALLPRAACVVCHGGLGVTQRSLLAGVPVVACPAGRDQFEVARRLEVAQAGIRIPQVDLTVANLREAVTRAIERSSGARRIATAFEAAGGACAAAAALVIDERRA